MANADEPEGAPDDELGGGPEDECPELPRIHALADGELTGREAARARRHLAGCARCRSELAFLLQLAVAVARGAAAIAAIAPIAPIGRPS